MGIRLLYRKIESESKGLLPEDCDSATDIIEATIECINKEFSGAIVSAWDEDEKYWVRLKDSTEGLERLLKNGGFLRVVKRPTAAAIPIWQRLSDNEVLSRLERDYHSSFLAHIQDKSSSTRASMREEPIEPDSKGIVDNLGACFKLEGYEELAKRGLMGLMLLQNRSEKLEPDESDNLDDPFIRGTQLLRIVGAPGTGKTTALMSLWGYIHDHFDELVATLPAYSTDSKHLHLRERVRSSLGPDCFLSFVFSNAGLTERLRDEEAAWTGNYMATRMLYAMLSPAQLMAYGTFLRQMDSALRLSLEPRHLMQFVQKAAGFGGKRGLVVFSFDECNAPEPDFAGKPTYFQDGLSGLVSWRAHEALQRFRSDGLARDLLPVIVLAGTDSSRMTLYRDSSRRAQVYDLGRAALGDASLIKIAMDAISRMAKATGREVPGSAVKLLETAVPWLGWNPRALVCTLQFAGEDPLSFLSDYTVLKVARLWKFLQLPPSASQDKVFAVLKKVEHRWWETYWAEWLGKVGDKEKEALFSQALAHTIMGCPVARLAELPGTNKFSWGDAENEGFVVLTVADDKFEECSAPDAIKNAHVYIPPLLLRAMYEQLEIAWTRVRSLGEFQEGWEDRERSDVALLMLRLQLARDLLGKSEMPLQELCPGLEFPGHIFPDILVPDDDYNLHSVRRQLNTAEFVKDYLGPAKRDKDWAFLGPGDWGPDGWLFLLKAYGG